MQLRGIISHPNPAMAEALQSLPKFQSLTEALDRAATALKAGNDEPAPESTADIVGAVYDALTAGESLPDAIETRALAATQVHARRTARLAVLEHVQNRLEGERDGLISSGKDRLFKSLNEQLRQVVADFDRIAPELGGVQTAEQAIAANNVEVWREASAIGRRHDHIRSAQKSLVGKFSMGYAVWLDGHGRIQNINQVWPEWLVWRRDGAMINRRTRQTVHLEIPWPDSGGIEFLRWSRGAGAELWCPDLETLKHHEMTVGAEAEERFYGRPTPLEQRTTTEPEDDGRLFPIGSPAAAGPQ